jgi:CBS domain-containing protein
MNNKPLTLTPDTSVSDALAQMKKVGVNAAPVTDSAGTVMGLFSLRNLIENILPVSMVSESGLSGVVVSAAPGLDLRLQKVMMQNVAAVMDRRFMSVYPDTAASRGAQLIAEKGESVIVLNEDTGRLEGMISDQDLVEGLLDNAKGSTRKAV